MGGSSELLASGRCASTWPAVASLPEDLLLDVFHRLGPCAAREALPLVCRAWARLLRQPVLLWNVLEIDFSGEAPQPLTGGDAAGPADKQVRADSLARWLAARGGAVRQLLLRNSTPASLVPPHLDAGSSGVDAPRHDFDPATLPRLLALVSPGLASLTLLHCNDLLSPPLFASLLHLHSLKALVLRGVRVAFGELEAAALSSLTGLTQLVIDCDQPPDSADAAPWAAAPAPGNVPPLPPAAANEAAVGALPGADLAEGAGGGGAMGGAAGAAGSPGNGHYGLPCLPPALLASNCGLQSLTLSCHYRVTLLPDEVSRMAQLEALALDYCSLQCLPPALGRLRRLASLDLEGNLFLGDRCWPGRPLDAAFPPQLAGLGRCLRTLNLGSCGLSGLPEVVASFTALQQLDLEGNELCGRHDADAELPESLSRLSRLEVLNIASCGLRRLPPVVASLTALESLDLSSNAITNEGLPPQLTRLQRLREIGLKKNDLAAVPVLLGSLTALHAIYLEDNPRLEVHAPLDYLVCLPQLEVVMIGKQGATWSQTSTHYIADFFNKMVQRNPSKEVLRITYQVPEPQARAAHGAPAAAAAAAAAAAQQQAYALLLVPPPPALYGPPPEPMQS